MNHEHDDDLESEVDEGAEIETDSYPEPDEELEEPDGDDPDAVDDLPAFDPDEAEL